MQKQSIKTDIILADALIMKFCKRVQRLYGVAAVTPNMHLYGHLREVLSDFGPVQEYWLFSFERYNGLLGNQPTNNRNIEPQLMKRFLLNNFAHSFTLPSEFNNDLNSLCNLDQQPIRGMALDVLSIPTNEIYCLPTRSTRATLNPEDHNFVTLLFQRLHPQTQNMLVISVFTKYSSLEIRGKRYNANQASIYMVKWDQTLFQQQPNIMEEALQIHFDLTVDQQESTILVKCHSTLLKVHSSPVKLVFARVSWYYPHTNRYMLGKPVQVWCPMFEDHFVYNFVPIHLFVFRCSYCTKIINDQSLLLITPLIV